MTQNKPSKIFFKLNSNQGASLLIALLVFLVASMVSVVIVSASLTAVKRVRDDQDEIANQLAVNSAARLVADCITESGFTVTKTTTTLPAPDENPNPSPTSNETLSYVGAETGPDSWRVPWGQLLYRLYDPASLNPLQDTTLEITAPTSSGTEVMPDCIVTLRMDSTSIGQQESSKTYPVNGKITTKTADGPTVYLTAYIASLQTYEDTKSTPDEGTVNTKITYYKWTDTELSTIKPKQQQPNGGNNTNE